MLSLACLFPILTMLGIYTGSTDLQALRSQIGDDHNWMMWASVSALSDEDREYLEPELELLIRHYCHFPDMNWSNYGEWGGWSGFPNSERTPDTRREWGISHACGYSPVSREGKALSLHGFPPACYTTVRELFPRVVELLSEGEHGDAVRVIGAVSHGIQDAATFPHIQAIHRASNFRYSEIAIPGYAPVYLGDSVEKAAETLAKRTEEMIHFTEKAALGIREAMLLSDWERDEKLRVECCNEAAKVVADLIHTGIILAGERPQRKEYPVNVNLIVNGDVEESDFGEPSPAGWIAFWNDPKDRIGVLDWEGRVSRNRNLWRSGRRSLKIMWASREGLEWRQTWPASLWVTPGERYQASAWMKTVDATGQTAVVLEFYSRNTDLISTAESASVDGTREWSQLSVEAEVPEGAERMRVILRSCANEGASWFDDIELMRIDPGERSIGPLSIHEPKSEERMMYLSFDEGKGTSIPDRSVFSGINGPNLSASAGVPYDLHDPDGWIGSAIAFDGVDDFVECPAHMGMDVQCPEKALTLSLWLWVRDYRDAVLVCKEQYPGNGQPKGYRLMLKVHGRLQFTIHTDAGDAVAESAYRAPLGQWFHVAAVRAEDDHLNVYVDGKPGETIHSPGAFRMAQTIRGAPSSLYLGADTGVRDFFAGKIDEFLLFNRALSHEEVIIQTQSGVK